MNPAESTGSAFARIERLVDAVERLEDPTARAAARDLVRAVLDLHRVGLDRFIALASAEGASAPGLLAAMSAEPAVAALLLLHGRHPVPFERRVREALAEMDSTLAPIGARVEVTSIAGDVVQLRMTSRTRGTVDHDALRRLVIETVLRAAPDAGDIMWFDAIDRRMPPGCGDGSR